MAKKFSLVPSPTFKKDVLIPIPGETGFKIEFVFKHRSRSQWQEFVDKLEGKEDVDLVLDIASGWNIDEPFNAESIEALTENYIGSGRAIFNTYAESLTAAKTGN